MKLALSAVEVVEQSRESFAYDGCQVLLENLRADIPTAGEPRANPPKVAARCSASAATFFVLGGRSGDAFLSPFLQEERNLNSVFCKNRGYNRKNLYPERLQIADFCTLGWLEIAFTYALAGIGRYDNGQFSYLIILIVFHC